MATLDNINPPLKEIPSIIDDLRDSFLKMPIRRQSDLRKDLNSIRKALVDDREALAKALYQDFHRSVQETFVLEYECVIGEIDYLSRHLGSLLKEDKVDEKGALFSTVKANVEKIPLGIILIVTPFNYPLILSMSPVIGGLAAGNSVALKLPYDKCPRFCVQLTKTLLRTGLCPRRLAVFNGGIPESSALMDQHFDKIVFTGSGRTGRIVLEKAATHLTPVVLELGGKSPTFLTSKCNNMEKAIRRILWGKFANAGQTCVAPDYLLVEDKVYNEAIVAIKKIYKELFPVVSPDTDFTHVVDDRSFERLTGYLAHTSGGIILGGKADPSTRFIEPTVVDGVDLTDALMKEELFGPILPIVRYSNLFKVVNTIRTTPGLQTPLALYIFSDSNAEREIIRTINSGGLCINETLMHAGCYATPFGGVGSSGCGNYHGKYSIKTFTHERVVMEQPYWAESLIKLRYPPYAFSKINLSLRLAQIPPMPNLTFWDVFPYIIILTIGVMIGRSL
ncbi:HFD1 [Brettanomyces bruxellensis]|uniref:Aldehyde dehydrogenase n=1 Tax=Dekkera bruxellensis TaxID=5007 RepID=A0A7D9CZ41_DEKBR|nr:HFD1 [Brettanomyces bruxellensis]